MRWPLLRPPPRASLLLFLPMQTASFPGEPEACHHQCCSLPSSGGQGSLPLRSCLTLPWHSEPFSACTPCVSRGTAAQSLGRAPGICGPALSLLLFSRTRRDSIRTLCQRKPSSSWMLNLGEEGPYSAAVWDIWACLVGENASPGLGGGWRAGCLSS